MFIEHLDNGIRNEAFITETNNLVFKSVYEYQQCPMIIENICKQMKQPD